MQLQMCFRFFVNYTAEKKDPINVKQIQSKSSRSNQCQADPIKKSNQSFGVICMNYYLSLLQN